MHAVIDLILQYGRLMKFESFLSNLQNLKFRFPFIL